MNTHDIDQIIDRIESCAPMDVAGRNKHLHDLRSAIEADRQRRGEPVACFKCGHSEHNGECVNVAPQPASYCTMGKHACSDPSQCWEPCGELGNSAEHAQVAEPVKVPSSFPTGTEYSVEPHGNGYAIYQGRDQFHHGLNLAHLTECTPEFSKRIESALNATYEPAKVPSKNDLLRAIINYSDARATITENRLTQADRYRDMNAHDECAQAYADMVALLARYGHPVEPEGWQLVPKKPTHEMIRVLWETIINNHDTTDGGYTAMLEAAPKFGEEE